MQKFGTNINYWFYWKAWQDNEDFTEKYDKTTRIW